MNIYVLAGRPSLKWPGQDLKHDSKRIQCQQHIILVMSVVLAIRKDIAREPRPTETWGDFPVSVTQHPPWHPNTHAIEHHGLGGMKERQGRQAASAPQCCNGQEEEEERKVLSPGESSLCRIPLTNASRLNTAETAQV